MTEVDPFSPEARDPFFVPDRTAEVSSFFFAAAFTAMTPVALLLVPLTLTNMGVIVLGGLFAALLCVEGLGKRRHRLCRKRRVAELTAGLLSPDKEPPRA